MLVERCHATLDRSGDRLGGRPWSLHGFENLGNAAVPDVVFTTQSRELLPISNVHLGSSRHQIVYRAANIHCWTAVSRANSSATSGLHSAGWTHDTTVASGPAHEPPHVSATRGPVRQISGTSASPGLVEQPAQHAERHGPGWPTTLACHGSAGDGGGEGRGLA